MNACVHSYVGLFLNAAASASQAVNLDAKSTVIEDTRSNVEYLASAGMCVCVLVKALSMLRNILCALISCTVIMCTKAVSCKWHEGQLCGI